MTLSDYPISTLPTTVSQGHEAGYNTVERRHARKVIVRLGVGKIQEWTPVLTIAIPGWYLIPNMAGNE